MSQDRCCPTDVKPVHSTYHPKGNSIYYAGLNNFTTEAGKKNKGILLISDIFGMHPNNYRLADWLAEEGFVVAMPNFFFREPAWDHDDWPADFQSEEWKTFVKRVSDFPAAYNDCDIAVETLRKTYNCEKVAAVGMCWGGKISLLSLHRNKVDLAISPHPSYMSVLDIQNAPAGPIYLLPSKDEAPMEDIKQYLLEEHPHKADNKFERFDNLHHGFLGARCDYETLDEVVKEDTNRAVKSIIDFLNKHM